MTLLRPAMLIIAAFTLVACEPEVGSAGWCRDMNAKAKNTWTAQEASDFTEYCVLGKKPG